MTQTPQATFPEDLAVRYEVLAPPMQGGMSYVFRCYDNLLGREVAVKFLKEKYSFQRGFQDRFEQEFTVLQNLFHPNVIQVFEHGYTDEGLPYYSMEWLEGVSVQDANLTFDEPLPLPIVRWIMTSLLSALEELHLAQVIHRDLKPQNLMITFEGTVKLIDFGLAKDMAFEGEGITSVGEIVGTAGFLTPEHVRPKHMDERSDVFGAGWVLYVLLTQELPPLCEMEPMEAIAAVYKRSYQLPRLRDFPHLDGKTDLLQPLLSRFLAHDKRKRYQTAVEASLALDAVLADIGPEDPQQSIDVFLSRMREVQQVRQDSMDIPTLAGSSVLIPTEVRPDPASEATSWLPSGLDWVELPEAEGFIGNLWGNEDECPPVQVKLSPFSISKYAVPASLFLQYLFDNPDALGDFEGNEYSLLQRKNGIWTIVPGAENLPVNCVTYQEALGFCEWLSATENAKVTLPTEAQWEAAASWDLESRQKFLYPWGMTPDYKRAHVQRRWTRPEKSLADVTGYEEGASPVGCVQMLGNVWEWCRDTYLPDAYPKFLGKDPWLERGDIEYRAIRGGDLGCQINNIRTSLRGFARQGFRLKFIGFRVVKED